MGDVQPSDSSATDGRGRVGAHFWWSPQLVLAAVLAVLIVATATSSAPRGGAAEQAAEFDRVYAAYRGWFVGERDERGTGYRHWRYEDLRDPAGDRSQDTEIDYARMGRGSQVALLRRDRNSGPGFGLDYLHQPGSTEDLVLIGERYREPVQLSPEFPPAPLATTLWVARPTTLADSGGWSPCATAGTAPFCALEEALALTRAAVPGVPRLVDHALDGTVTARTGVRFIDLVAANIAPTNARQLAALEPMLHDLVPFTIVFGPDGQLVRAELNGRFGTRDAVIEVQLGQEHLGTATAADFPPGPTDDSQITRVSRLEWTLFVDDADALATRDLANGSDAHGPR